MVYSVPSELIVSTADAHGKAGRGRRCFDLQVEMMDARMRRTIDQPIRYRSQRYRGF